VQQRTTTESAVIRKNGCYQIVERTTQPKAGAFENMTFKNRTWNDPTSEDARHRAPIPHLIERGSGRRTRRRSWWTTRSNPKRIVSHAFAEDAPHCRDAGKSASLPAV
jgi:hypothetical protein